MSKKVITIYIEVYVHIHTVDEVSMNISGEHTKEKYQNGCHLTTTSWNG